MSKILCDRIIDSAFKGMFQYRCFQHNDHLVDKYQYQECCSALSSTPNTHDSVRPNSIMYLILFAPFSSDAKTKIAASVAVCLVSCHPSNVESCLSQALIVTISPKVNIELHKFRICHQSMSLSARDILTG
jgi:hypothetical protein